MRLILSISFISIFFAACGSDNNKVDLPKLPTNAVPTIDTPISKVARIDTMPTIIDTVSTDSTRPRKVEKPNFLPPQITFKDTIFNFGTIVADSVVEHLFEFTNTGDKPLEISSVVASCGCTASSYPFLPITKHEKNSITAKFDSKGKTGRQEKTLTVHSNDPRSPHTLIVKGTVKSKE